MNSSVKFPAAHFRRRPSLPSLRVWVLPLLLASLASLFSMGVARPRQDFPIAAENHHYIFRSDGTYSFSYDTGGGEHQSFRIEARDANGRVSGRYGYIDPDGVLRITQYEADSTGYRANMLIYRKVSSPPPEPLLVGPLPRRLPEPDPEFTPRNAPQRPSSRPIGPVPFFPPDKPILIIGPLPKPLQPPRDERDFDLDEGFDFEGISLSSLAQGVSQDSAIKDVPPGPPPGTIRNGVLETILQDNFSRIFRGSSPSLFGNPTQRGSQDISVNTLQFTEGTVPLPTSQVNLEKISQGLLQGPEVIVNTIPKKTGLKPLPLRPLRRNMTLTNSTEERVPRTPAVNFENKAATTRINNPPMLNNAFDVFIKVVTDFPRLNRTQERQNSSKATTILNSTTPTPPIMLKINHTTFSPTPVTRVLTPLTALEIKREKVSKPDTDRAPSVAVSINLPPVPPLTYLPAESTKTAKHSTFVGQLPNY